MRRNQRGASALVKMTADLLRNLSTEIASRFITKHHLIVINGFLYVMIHSSDLSILTEDFALARLHSRKRVYARLIAVHAIALFDGAPEIMKQITESNPAFGDSMEGQALLAVAAGMRPIRKTYDRKLRQMRNTVFAHRETDARKQLEIIDSINVMEFFRLQSQLMQWTTAFKAAALAIMRQMTEQLEERRPEILASAGHRPASSPT
jgi:hypothetical protein